MRADTYYRAQVFNSLLKLAWTQADRLAIDAAMKRNAELREDEWETNPERKGLGEPDTKVLGLLLLCNNALEARVNHMIDQLRDNGEITNSKANRAKQLAPQCKWFLLPQLAGSSEKLDEKKPPHDAVVRLCRYRNNIVHAKFDKLREPTNELPKPEEAMSLWNELLDAFEDMNVRLKWGAITGPRKEIDELKFHST